MGSQFLSKYMWGMYSHSHEYRKLFLRFLFRIFAPTKNSPRENSFRCEYTPRLYAHPHEYKKNPAKGYLWGEQLKNMFRGLTKPLCQWPNLYSAAFFRLLRLHLKRSDFERWFHATQRLRNHYDIQQMASSSGKIRGFSSLGVADICRKLCDLRSKTQIPPSQKRRKYRRILYALFV